ncbi:50S ribosomal protein L40e [Candidatus Woesearchaeota archaeon]|nr:50S ribosomal protein L40e [Candidatus Woesearchaeota archaeon]
MPKKIEEAAARRLFLNMFVCMKCNAKMRAQPDKVRKKLIKCRKCGSKNLRLKAKERRGAKV